MSKPWERSGTDVFRALGVRAPRLIRNVRREYPMPAPRLTCRRLLMVTLVIASLLAATLAVLVASRSEPRYGGKRLTVWLKDWYRPPTPGSNPMAFEEFARKRKEAEA